MIRVLPLVVCFTIPVVAAPITFPSDGGILSVTEFGAIPDDGGDDTAAIQKALNKHPNGNRIIYLPPGKYLISDTLKWPKGESGGHAHKRTILQGAGEKLSVLSLPANSPGFGGDQSKALIWTGSKPAQRFRNAVRDLTIEIGAGNPGAIGLQFNASNQGAVKNVTIRAAKNSGKIGLDLGHTDEIGPLLVRNLTVDGFETGISTKWPVNSNTFEHITLRNQRKYGWLNYHQMIFVRGLTSTNSVPAIYNQKDSWGTVSLVDSKLTGDGSPEAKQGILNQRQLYLRNVEITGYQTSVNNADKGRDKGDIKGPGVITEDTSHANVASLYRDLPDKLLPAPQKVPHLPVKEIPDVPWGDVEKDWANINDFGGDPKGFKDSSAALQRAIDSKAKTVYLPAGGTYRFEGRVIIRGPVQRIIGLEGRYYSKGFGVWDFVDEGPDDAPVVVIERICCRSGDDGMRIEHHSKRTLVVSSSIGFKVDGHSTGDIFIDDLAGSLNLYNPGQSAWCRQLNTERTGTMLLNNGSKLWILGMKTEKIGTVIRTRNGGHTDATGIFIYSNQGWDEEVPAFRIENSTAVLAGINERNFNRKPVSLWFQETHGEEIRERKDPAWIYLSK